MKKRRLLLSLISAAMLLCSSGAKAQSLLYENDFENGVGTSTIQGNGVIENSNNAAHGMVFHNAATGQAVRTNYLKLPSTILSDLQTAGTNALSVSFWVNKGTATGYYWSPIFSAYATAPNPTNGMPMMVIQLRGWAQANVGGTWCDFSDAQNVKKANAIGTAWIDDGNWHFYTIVYTPTNLKVYVDGIVQNEWALDGTALGGSLSGLFTAGSTLPYLCLGGNQAWGWNDPDPAFLYDKVKIYSGALTSTQINSLIATDALASPVITADNTNLFFDENHLSRTIVVNGANLAQDISITAPAGLTVSPTSISKSAATDVTVTVTYNGTSSVKGNIALTSGSTVLNVKAMGATNTGCFTPAYPTGNMIADPTFSEASLSTGGFGGWGPTGLVHANAYCGTGSAYIRGSCWPDGGSIDRTLSDANGNALKANTKYRIRAMVNSKASPGTSFQFQIEGVNGTGSIYFQLPNTNGWKQIDTTFTTASTITAGKGIYFNSCGSSTPAITDTCFIDNYEMYAVPKVYPSAASLTFLQSGATKKVAVRAIGLTQDITITASTGFTVSPSTMAATVNGDSLSVTFNSATSKTGYVYFTSGSVKDSMQVTGTVAPTLLTSAPYVSLDELNNSGTFTVTGGNLVAGITMSAPAGITLTPSTLPSSANGATVTVSYDGNATSSGYITLTSTTATTRVRVRAVRNADSYSALYSSGNLITDTYLNDISNFGGWGNHSINTDTAFVYSGSRSGKVAGGQCAGSLDRVLTGIMKPSTKYRVKAMVYAQTGSFQIGVWGWWSGKADTTSIVSTTGSWQTVDFEFTTGATLGADQGMFFNSCWTGGQTGYIDNWEAYEVSNTTGVNYLNKDNQKVYITNNKLVSDFTLNKESVVSISVYDMQGKLVSKYSNWCEAGRNNKTINAPASKGVYIVKITSDEFSISRKLTK